MNYLKGYKPVDLNKGDFKHIEKFSDIEGKDDKIVNEIRELLHNKKDNCEVYALIDKKEKKYKSIYFFKSEENENNKILRFYKSVSLDDVSKETIKTFEDVIFESLKEVVSIDERWKKVIWGDNVIEPHMIRIGSINLSASVFGILLGVLLYVITGEFFWFMLGLCIGFGSGAVVSKIGDQKEKQGNSEELNKEDNENKNHEEDKKE